MEKTEKIQSSEVIIVYTYRYIWKTKDGKLCVKFLTDVQEAHKTFQTNILKDDNIVSCAREYMHEVNFSYLGFTEPVKEENIEKGKKRWQRIRLKKEKNGGNENDENENDENENDGDEN